MPQRRTARGSVSAGACIAAALAAMWGALAGGCREHRSDKPPRQFFPDMDDQMKWNPQNETPFFADGRTMRPHVEGVVAYAAWDLDPAGWPIAPRDGSRPSQVAQLFDAQRADTLKHDDAFYKGISGRTETGEDIYLDYMPVPVTQELIRRGQERFNIFCAVCHGYGGEGAAGPSVQRPEGSGGMVGRRWATPPANFHDAGKGYLDRSQRTGKDGYIFHTIRHGLPNVPPVREEEVTLADGSKGILRSPSYKMPPYAHAINEHDAWAIVAYIRALQASRNVHVDDPILPASEREALRPSRPPEPPPPVKPGDAATPTGGTP